MKVRMLLVLLIALLPLDFLGRVARERHAPQVATATIAPQPPHVAEQPTPPPVVSMAPEPPSTAPAVNWWVVVGLIGTTLWTNVAMILLKRGFPEWDKKAWAPPVIGLVTALLGALAAGQITSWESLLLWLGAGAGAGAVASSVRDVKVGR